MQFSNHALDIIATDLSKFTDPDLPELILPDEKTLQNHFLECVIGVFGGEGNAHIRFWMTNIVRRVYASMETYKLGRHHALDYVSGDRREGLSAYFVALTNFESCVSYSWQVADLFRTNPSNKKDKVQIYEQGDGSAWERLHDVYTVGTKHSFEELDPENPPPHPSTVWLTNEGIACMNGAHVTFHELVEIIDYNNGLFYDMQSRAHEKWR